MSLYNIMTAHACTECYMHTMHVLFTTVHIACFPSTMKQTHVPPVGLLWINVDLVAGAGVDTEHINHLHTRRAIGTPNNTVQFLVK